MTFFMFSYIVCMDEAFERCFMIFIGLGKLKFCMQSGPIAGVARMFQRSTYEFSPESVPMQQ